MFLISRRFGCYRGQSVSLELSPNVAQRCSCWSATITVASQQDSASDSKMLDWSGICVALYCALNQFYAVSKINAGDTNSKNVLFFFYIALCVWQHVERKAELQWQSFDCEKMVNCVIHTPVIRILSFALFLHFQNRVSTVRFIILSLLFYKTSCFFFLRFPEVQCTRTFWSLCIHFSHKCIIKHEDAYFAFRQLLAIEFKRVCI